MRIHGGAAGGSQKEWASGQRVTAVRSVEHCFFFQAEDGIRDYKVTGVQTCALPICIGAQLAGLAAGDAVAARGRMVQAAEDVHQRGLAGARGADDGHHLAGLDGEVDVLEQGDGGVTGGDLPAQSPHLQQWLVHAHIPMGSGAGALFGPASPITTCSPASRPDSTWAWALVRRPMRTLRSATLPSPSRTRTV